MSGMIRSELVDRLKELTEGVALVPGAIASRIVELIKDVEEDGVLDVQAPDEVKRELELPEWEP